MTGKVWIAPQEVELRALVTAGNGVDAIAGKLEKTPKAVITKCQRMGLQLDSRGYVNTSVSILRSCQALKRPQES